MGVTPDAIRQLLDELEANRRSRRTAWATLQRLRKFLEANGTKINIPDDRNFETEGDASESGLRRLSVILTRLVADRKVGAWAARSHAEQPTSVRHLLSERSSQILPSTNWARIEYSINHFGDGLRQSTSHRSGYLDRFPCCLSSG